MSVLPKGQPLERVIPDLEQLLETPSEYLQAGSVVIGPRQMYKLAAMFAIPGIACLVAYYLKQEEERLFLGVGLLLGSLVWVSWSLFLRGHQLVLHPDGLEVVCRGTVAWCPWALFNADGKPYVPESDNPHVGLTLPIDPAALPHVELRRDDTVIAHGAQVRCPQLVFNSPSEVVLPARYEAAADQLGILLQELGRRLGRQLPRTTPPPAAYPSGEAQPELEPDADGWILMHLTRLRWPRICAECGGPADDVYRIVIMTHVDRFLGIVGGIRELAVDVPMCQGCRAGLAARQHTASLRGILLGAILGPAFLIAAVLVQALGRDGILVTAILALAVGGLVGLFGGISAGRKAPVRFRAYSPARGTVKVRFRHPERAEQFLAFWRSDRANLL